MLMSLYTKLSFVLFLLSEVFFPNTIINQFAILIMCGVVFLLCLTNKKIHFHFYFLFALLLILQSYFFSYNGISINQDTSLAMSNTLTFNYIIALVVYNYILITDNLEKSLFIFARIGLLFTIIVSIFSLDNIFSERLGSDISFSLLGKVVGYNSNTIALIAGFSLLIYLYKYNKRNKSIFNLLLFLWLIIIILLTGSRKGVILLVLGVPLLIFLLKPEKRIRNISIGTLSIIILYWLVMNIPILYHIAGYRIEALVSMILGGEVEEASANTRKLYIERGWNYFLQKPWTGYGLDNFRNLPFSYGTYSHNNYIELLVSGGIISFILYYFIRIIVLVKLYINRNKNKVNKLLFVILLLLLFLEYGLVDYFIRIYMVLFIFALCCQRKIN